MTCPTYKAAGSRHGHSRHGPGQPLDRFPVSPSPCLSRHLYIRVHSAGMTMKRIQQRPFFACPGGQNRDFEGLS